jgi:DNA-damage-inducible protein D
MTQVDLFGTSPFDALRRTDEHGEHWTGRELMTVMQYQNWEDFRRIVTRAHQSAKNSGHDADHAFSAVTEKGTGGRPREDFRLTRFAAYLVAMNGDPNKPEVASAQAYFAVKTRQAEAAEVALGDPLDELELANDRTSKAIAIAREQKARAEAAETALAEAAPKADAWDVLASAKGDYSVREAAHILNRDPQISTGQNRLFKTLRALGLVDRNDVPYATHASHVCLRPTSFFNPHRGREQKDEQLRVTADGLRYLRKRLGSPALPGLAESP